MIEWPQFLENGLPIGEKFSSVTIGVFDGVHLGHKALIKRVISHDPNNVPVAVVFKQNHEKGRSIQTFRQKAAMFKGLGLAVTLVVEFTESLKKTTGIDFLKILQERGRMGFLAVGVNFRCGRSLDTDAVKIQQYCSSQNISVEIVENIMEGSRPVSSSRIRSAIARGKFVEAASLLGFPFSVDLAGRNTILPPSGRYPVLLRKTLEEPGTEAEIFVEGGSVRIPPFFADKHWEYAEFISSNSQG